MKKILIMFVSVLLLASMLCGCVVSRYGEVEWSAEEIIRVREGIAGNWQSEDGSTQLFIEIDDSNSGICMWSNYKEETNTSDTIKYVLSFDNNILILSDGNEILKYSIAFLAEDNTKLILISEDDVTTIFQAVIS